MKIYGVFAVGAMILVAAEPNVVRFGPDGRFQLLSNGVTERLADGTSKLFPLPQSTLEMYASLRPADLARNPIAATGNRYEREESIGPHQIESDKLWFGNNFYDSEGQRGVGAFGYFNAATRLYQLYSPPEVAPYEVSAILVEKDSVWLGLDYSSEDISVFPGGLVEWNRASHAVRRYPIEFVVSKIERQSGSLRLTTRSGYALLKGDRFERFEGTTPVDKFPPPPSHHALL